MALDKRIYWIALGITAVLFITVIITANFLNQGREQIIDVRLDDLASDYKDLQTILLLSEIYGDEFFCIGVREQLNNLDQSLWKTGEKIEKYQEASSTFTKDPLYNNLKKIFNQNQVYYLSLFKNFKEKCEWNNKVVMFFYKSADKCSNCDEQSFVLTDIKQDLEEDIAIFSFDMDLGLKSLNAIASYHEIEEYPCMIIEEEKHCGLMNKNTVKKLICEEYNHTYCN
jgi:hypothetical protein